MGLIREPNGIDFFVDPRSLTKDEEATLSNFIKADKAKRATKENIKKEDLNQTIAKKTRRLLFEFS